jgi:hypothetical protein
MDIKTEAIHGCCGCCNPTQFLKKEEVEGEEK